MSKQMLINTIDEEESRMAILEDGQLTEYSIKMAMREPVMGNIYKGVVRNIQRGLRAAFVDYGVGKSGFLPLRDVSDLYCESDGTLKIGKELFVQVVREGKGEKGAMLTTYLSLPGRYLVLMPNKESRGISRKIESEADRKKLKQFMDEISDRENMGFIVRTAGINRTKQELTRDFQMLVRLWRDIEKKAERMPAPALVYKESEFAVRVFRDFFTSDIDEILIDNIETLKKMKAYCKAVSPRNVKSIKQYRGETPIFDTYNVEEQINAIYRERVELKSGGSLVIEPTEAVITIDVNSGRLNRRDAEETAFRTNLEAAEEIAKQLRLRDLGGLIVVDFIDMMERKHNAEVERTFKNALKNDRSRIQLAKISKFGILELSRQKKESTIQEISYTICSRCKGSGWVPSIEYLALSTYRKIKSEVVRRDASEIEITLPSEVASYLLNHKRREISQLEQSYNVSVVIFGSTDMFWPDSQFKVVKKEPVTEQVVETSGYTQPKRETAEKEEKLHEERVSKPRRRGRRRKPKTAPVTTENETGITDNEQTVKEGPNEMEIISDSAKDQELMNLFEEETDEQKEKRSIITKFYNLLKI